jgi:hypothetical protein
VTARAVWRRLSLPGHDAAQVLPDGDGWRLCGMAAFRSASGPAALAYEVACDGDWITRQGLVRGFVEVYPELWAAET